MAGGNKVIKDSLTGRTGYRMSVNKDYKAGYTEVPYTSGHTLHWQKTEGSDGKGRRKEIRTLVKIDQPHETWVTTMGDDYGDKFDRIFKKGKYAEETKTDGE